MDRWVKRWGYLVAPGKPTSPGVFRLKGGGYLVRGRVTDPGDKTKRVTVIRALPHAKAEEARRALDQLKSDGRAKLRGQRPARMRFDAFAASLFEAKVAAGEIKSAKGIEKWASALTLHIVPEFGAIDCRDLTTWHLAQWRSKLAEMSKGYRWIVKLRNGKEVERSTLLSPRTANTWISIMCGICAAMTSQFEITRDPARDLKPFDTSQRPTYTEEAPNALTTEQAARFLAEMRERFPQHYAMTLLGFVTGKRPSTLRPLRAKGDSADVDWAAGSVKFRQSHTRGDQVMIGTKTGSHEVVHLPRSVVAVLEWHRDTIADPPVMTRDRPPMWWSKAMAETDLLFPSRKGGLRTANILDKPFRIVAKRIGVRFTVSPRAMRRTFQDLARDAKVHDVVTKSISGHRTQSMQDLYSTANADEQREAISNVIRLVIPDARAGSK